jgi:hypothetical protein
MAADRETSELPMSGRAARGAAYSLSVTDDDSRWLDLVSEMHAAVWEEAPLHEITLGTVDHLSADRKVVHGPWTAEECQSVLLPWHRAGWIELIADVDPPWSLTSAEWRPRALQHGAFLVLAADDATALLGDHARWVLGTADGHVMLCRTDEGETHEHPEWIAVAEQSRTHG